MSEKRRIDALLVERGLAPSRERAKLLIMEGLVYVNHQKTDKAGDTVPADAEVEVRGKGLPYVSRGGLKLEKAMAQFPIVLDGKVTMDIGASTGGFTDCMLQNGAATRLCHRRRIWPARMEAAHRSARGESGAHECALSHGRAGAGAGGFFQRGCVVHLAFARAARRVPSSFEENGEAVCLVKPQFEAGRGKVGKKGVVRDPAVHREVLEKAVGYALSSGFSPLGLTYSPVKGPEGNIEYLLYLRREAQPRTGELPDLSELVEESHRVLNGGGTV